MNENERDLGWKVILFDSKAKVKFNWLIIIIFNADASKIKKTHTVIEIIL